MTKTIGFAQVPVIFGERTQNLAAARQLLSTAGQADLIVLPELAFTGYDFQDCNELEAIAEPATNGPTSDFLREFAETLNAVIVAGYPERAGDTFYNSAMMVLPDGTIHNYRKIHLFSRENDLFSPGDSAPTVYDTPAGRIGMMICFDWFFPEIARLLALAGAQIIAHPSNLVLPYCQRAMYCRSVENHVYSITANRIGTENRTGRSLTFTGGSQVLNPEGAPLISASATETTLKLVQCNPELADEKQINAHNNLMAGRRTDLYGSLLTRPVN